MWRTSSHGGAQPARSHHSAYHLVHHLMHAVAVAECREGGAMRTTVTIDDELLERARELTGTQERSALLRDGLRALIAQEAGRRLIALGGSDQGAAAAPRHRPSA